MDSLWAGLLDYSSAPGLTAAAVSPIALVVAPAGEVSPELILRVRDGRLESIEIAGDGALHETFPSPDTLEPPVAVHPG